MIVLIRSAVFLLSLLLAVPSMAQDNAADIEQILRDIEEEHTQIELKLVEYTEKLDGLLADGYGTLFRKDMADIADNVGTLQLRLVDLAARLAELGKSALGITLEPFTISIRRGSSEGPALTGTVTRGDHLYFVANVPNPQIDQEVTTKLVWTVKQPDNSMSRDAFKVEDVERNGPSGEHQFSLPTTDLTAGTYEVALEHQIEGAPDSTYVATANFEIKETRELAILNMIADNEPTGDLHLSLIEESATPHLFVYFKASPSITAVTANLRVVDLTNGTEIYQKTGRRNINPTRDQQFIRIRLNPEKYPFIAGNNYKFSVLLQDNFGLQADDFSQPDVVETRGDVTFAYGATEEENEEDNFGDEFDNEDDTEDAFGNDEEVITAQDEDTDQSEWGALVADADANPGDYIYEEQNTEVVTTKDTGDGWDSVDEIDGDVVGYVDENQINAMRDKMAQQAEYDKNRISANAHGEYVQVQAERRRAREEYLRQQAQRQAELAETLRDFANVINGTNQPTPRPPVRTSTPTSRSSGGSSGGGMTNAQYQRLLKQCMDAKYAKARNSGFPIMDPNGPRIQCNSEIRRRMQGGSSSSSGNSFVQNAGGGDQCKAVAKGSKNPRRWEACCRKGGEIRYNAFTTPDGSRTGMSAYRCMQKGTPDKPKYMINIK